MKVRERWINIIHRAATGTRRTRTLLTPVGLVIFGAFTALFVFAAALADKLLSLPDLFPPDVSLLLSIPVMAIGAIITAWSGIHFLKVKGTPVPFNPPQKIVTSGPYRLVRNPMLTGVFILLLGIGFGINSVSSVFFFTPLFVLVNYWELKKIEEPELEMRFGDEFTEYRRQTPMFIPGVKAEKPRNR